MIQKQVILSVLVGLTFANDLQSLLEGIKLLEVIEVNGTIIDSDYDYNNHVSTSKDENDQLIVSYEEDGILYVERSTGLPSDAAQELLNIIQSAVGSRYRILSSIKMGGRLLAKSDIIRLNHILKDITQNVEIYINDNLVDLSKARKYDDGDNLKVLELIEYPGYQIIYCEFGTTLKTSSNGDQVKMTVGKGLNKKQIERLKENFYSIIAQKASVVTGLPKELFRLTLSGREEIINKLKRILKPTERVKIGNQIIDLDKTKCKTSSNGTSFSPKTFPQVNVTWKTDGRFCVESKDGTRIEVVYSKGVDDKIIERIVYELQEAIVLRLSLMSWSNGILGSIPPELIEDLKQLKTQIQKRKILVDDKEVDLENANIIEISEDSVVYRLPDGNNLQMFYNDDSISSPNKKLTVELTSGITKRQVYELFSNMNELFLTSVKFSDEEWLNDESNRNHLKSLLRGIKSKENIKVDGEMLELSNATIVRENSELIEYTVESLDDITISKFSKGDLQVNARGQSILVSRNTGISLTFLNNLVEVITNLLPRKRWFYNFKNKTENYKNHRVLQKIVDDIPKLIQNQSVSIDGNEIDFMKASILSVNDFSTVYTPETNSSVIITRFTNGDIMVSAKNGQQIAITVSQGITFQDADFLVNNIKKIIGDKFKVEVKRTGNFWCSTGDMRKLISWLLNSIVPQADINLGIGSNQHFSTSTRDFSKDAQWNNLIISKYNGRGVNITSINGEKFDISLSTGLTQEKSFELIQYLVSLLKDKDNVIRMITGSISEDKIKKIKDLVINMIQTKVVEIDSQLVVSNKIRDGNNIEEWSVPRSNKKIIIGEDEYGNTFVNSVKRHSVSVAVSPGIRTKQAEDLYRNIKEAFKDKFSEITHVPIQVINIISEFKKTFMNTYLFFSALPKEYISINGQEIRLKNLTKASDEDTSLTLDLPSGAKIIKTSDGSLNILLLDPGHFDVIKTTGFTEEQVDRIMRSVEFELGVKNKMFRIISDELFSTPDRYEKLEPLLKRLTQDKQLFVNDVNINLRRPSKEQIDGDCSLNWFKRTDDLVLKTCQGGQITLDSRQERTVYLRIFPGISSEQFNYISKSFQKTINTKSSNIKHLSNYLDTFLILLADGRIKSLEKIIFTVIPREDIFVDGNRINLETLELTQDEDFELTESNARPGFEIYRYRNGSTQLKSLNGGYLDVHCNTGLTLKLVGYILHHFKEITKENIGSYIIFFKEMFNGSTQTLVNVIDYAFKHRDSDVNITLLVDKIEEEIISRIHRLSKNQDVIRVIAENAVQKQNVIIEDEPVDWNQCQTISSGDGIVTCSPKDRDYIKITRYDNGRLRVDSIKEEAITVAVSAGIPQKMLKSFTKTITNYLQNIDSAENYIHKVIRKLSYTLKTMYEYLIEGITNRRIITLNAIEMLLTEENLIRQTESDEVYEKDDVLVKLNAAGNTEIKITSPVELELDISSGLITKSIMSFLLNKTLEISQEAYQIIQNFEPLAPIITKLEKVIFSLMDLLQQKIYINGILIDDPSMEVIQLTDKFNIIKNPNMDGLQITQYKDGRLKFIMEKKEKIVIIITEGLSTANQKELLANVERTFSSFNPVELVAGILELLPKNFFLLAQNMDRVMPIMNLIKF